MTYNVVLKDYLQDGQKMDRVEFTIAADDVEVDSEDGDTYLNFFTYTDTKKTSSTSVAIIPYDNVLYILRKF